MGEVPNRGFRIKLPAVSASRLAALIVIVGLLEALPWLYVHRIRRPPRRGGSGLLLPTPESAAA
jgi:hypothetical protein